MPEPRSHAVLQTGSRGSNLRPSEELFYDKAADRYQRIEGGRLGGGTFGCVWKGLVKQGASPCDSDPSHQNPRQQRPKQPQYVALKCMRVDKNVALDAEGRPQKNSHWELALRVQYAIQIPPRIFG